ncbi:MAG TPA: uracil-DNA glycosylase family protein, partial [Paracoccaceae bacterium]|nr:uracil-DNA glycosylase family protein [Paracoccaceae bacterium]
MEELVAEIAACRLCAERFAATVTAHAPRPVVWLSSEAPVLVCGQAPGARVHASGIPFDDPSGDRLRDWMGLTREEFYDRRKVAVLPMA